MFRAFELKVLALAWPKQIQVEAAGVWALRFLQVPWNPGSANSEDYKQQNPDMVLRELLSSGFWGGYC